MTDSSTHPKVIIIGGGLGGLTCAQALRKQGVPFKIYERDNNDHSRVQGWAITLSVSLPGIANDFPDDMPPVSSVSISKNLNLVGVDFNIYDGATGEKFPVTAFLPPTPVDQAPKDAPLRGNRRWFRELLTHNLAIEWNKKFSSYLEDETGVTVYFTDGTSERCDVLVGADGSTSHVRAQLLGHNVGTAWALPYATIIGETTLDEAATKRLWSLSRGMYMVKGKGASLFVSYSSVASDFSSSDWYYFLIYEDVGVTKEQHWLKTASKQQMYDHVVKVASPMKPELREIIELGGPESISSQSISFKEFYPPYGLPRGRVTLIGDALHTMTPFRGLGANTACLDALEVARAVTSSLKQGTNIIDNFKAYEELAIPRGKSMVHASHEIGISIPAKDHSLLYGKAMKQAQKGRSQP